MHNRESGLVLQRSYTEGGMVLPDEIKRIEPLGRMVHHGRGEVVFMHGDAYRGFYVVRDGFYKIYRTDSTGQEAILQLRGKGDLIGSLPLITREENYPTFCEALEKSNALFIDAEAVEKRMAADPSVQHDIYNLVGKQAIYFREKLASMMMKSVTERIVDFFVSIGAHEEPAALPVKKNQLALFVGATPEAVSRSLRKLYDEQRLVEVGGRYRLIQ